MSKEALSRVEDVTSLDSVAGDTGRSLPASMNDVDVLTL